MVVSCSVFFISYFFFLDREGFNYASPLDAFIFLNRHLDYNYFLDSKGAVTHWRMSRTSAGHFKNKC